MSFSCSFALLAYIPSTWSSLISCFFPIRNDFYWFVSAYFLLILLSPFITIGIKALGQRKLFTFLLIFGFFWSVIPTLTTKPEYYGSTLFWFCVSLFLGRVSQRLSRKENLLPIHVFVGLRSELGHYCHHHALADWNNRVRTFIGYIDWFTFANLYSVFSLICALSLFVFFKQMQIGYKPWINKFAVAMFGVYLIHENPIVYPWLWSRVFHVPEYLGSSWFILYALAVITIVFFYLRDFGPYLGKGPSIRISKYLFPRLQPLDKRVTDFLNAPASQK